MSKAKRCDACDKPIRQSQHEAVLSDLTSGQEVGRYHAPDCSEVAAKYLGRSGSALYLSFLHPDGCMPEYGYCKAGMDTNTVMVLMRDEGAA